MPESRQPMLVAGLESVLFWIEIDRTSVPAFVTRECLEDDFNCPAKSYGKHAVGCYLAHKNEIDSLAAAKYRAGKTPPKVMSGDRRNWRH